MTKHDITVSQLVLKASLADSTVYGYTGGRKKNIPILLWKALYEITEDSVILNLVIGEVETIVVFIPKDFECKTEILNILSDAEINKDDLNAIRKYKGLHRETIKLNNQIYHDITTEFNKPNN